MKLGIVLKTQLHGVNEMNGDTKIQWLEDKHELSDLAYTAIAIVICAVILLIPYFTFNEPESVCVTTKLSLTKGEAK